jgi:phosphatidylglycerol:prolipoprotein diacylglycerol transferase
VTLALALPLAFGLALGQSQDALAAPGEPSGKREPAAQPVKAPGGVPAARDRVEPPRARGKVTEGAIPYFTIPAYKVFGLLPIQPFGVLVGIAIVVGYMLGRRRASLTGLDPNICADGMVWVVASGFVVAHLVSVIFYFPHQVVEDPLSLVKIWTGLSSFGGFIGGALGAYLYFKRKMKVSLIKYVDAIIFGLVPAWILGRMGCTIVSDHIGKPTSFFLGMDYPSWMRLSGVRHNLGLYEMLFAIVLTVILYSLKNVKPFDGFHPALVLLLYSPVRFLLDYLRVEDKTYFGLTPGQYLAVGMVGLALFLIVRGVGERRALAEAPS